MTTVHTDHHVTLDTGTASAAWANRAREVARQLSGDAARRDREGNPPYAEVKLLKDSGGHPAGPGRARRGRRELDHRAARREGVRADGSIGQLLGYHYLWAWAARRSVAEPQVAEIEEAADTNEFAFFGGAVAPARLRRRGREDEGERSGSVATEILRRRGHRDSRPDPPAGRPPGRPTSTSSRSPLPPIARPRLPRRLGQLGQRLTETGSMTSSSRACVVPWARHRLHEQADPAPLVYNSLYAR